MAFGNVLWPPAPVPEGALQGSDAPKASAVGSLAAPSAESWKSIYIYIYIYIYLFIFIFILYYIVLYYIILYYIILYYIILYIYVGHDRDGFHGVIDGFGRLSSMPRQRKPSRIESNVCMAPRHSPVVPGTPFPKGMPTRCPRRMPFCKEIAAPRRRRFPRRLGHLRALKSSSGFARALSGFRV